MLKLMLIRHGMTEGNALGRYIGVTDEGLSPEGRRLLEKQSYPRVQLLFVSPLLRCRQTAGILFPGQEFQVVEELSECDFGEFENKNYRELDGNPRYQAWVDSNAALPFPGGESREEFQARSLRGFEKAVTHCLEAGASSAALVIHGGTIMNIMEAWAGEKREFYQWHVKNGCGYAVELDPILWSRGERRLRLCGAL